MKTGRVEERLEAEVAAVFEHDIVTADYIRNEVSRKQEGKEQSDANDKKRSVALNIYSDLKEHLSPKPGHQIHNFSFSQHVKLKLLKNSLALRFDAGFGLIVIIKFL